MARNKQINDAAFHELHTLMEDMPKKHKESWEDYTKRVNLRSTCSVDYSKDTLQRIHKSNSLEEYQELIRKKHPVKKEQVVQLKIPIVQEDSLEELYNRFVPLMNQVCTLWNEINEREAKKDAAAE